MYACEKGHYKVIKELLRNGATTEYYNNNGYTPLMQAAYDGNILAAKVIF